MSKPSEATITGERRPLGYQQVTPTGTAAGVTPPAVPAASGLVPGYMVVQCNGGVVRWRDDGTAPTASIGMSIADGSEMNYVGDFYAIQFILSSGTPILDISFYA